MDEQIGKIVLIGMHNASEASCTRMSLTYLNRFLLFFLLERMIAWTESIEILGERSTIEPF